MKIIKYALLLSGLFFSFYSFSQPQNEQCEFGSYHEIHGCITTAPFKNGFILSSQGISSDVSETLEKAFSSFASKFSRTAQDSGIDGFCSYVTTNVRSAELISIDQQSLGVKFNILTTMSTIFTTATPGITCPTVPPSNTTVPSESWATQTGSVFYCPPDPPYADFITKVNIGGVEHCSKKSRPPLDCSGLKGLGASALYDSYVTKTSAGYSKDNQPSCLTKCAKDANGVQKCGDCKVAASSWSYQSSIDGSTQKWWANAGTFTGAACGEKESETPPPEATKCWETTNGLSMCIQDPAEKCVTVSGVQQCEAGCGYVNGEFYCAEKEPPKPNPNDNDKPIPDPDDNITNPEKPISDMNKGDFKDVQRGVESRVASVGVAVGNLENSVDGLGNTLDSMNDKLDKANGIGEAQLGYLKGIKDAVTDGDDGGEPDGNCDPLKDKKCDGNTGASGIKSWWNSKYPDGLGGLMNEKKEAFFESEAYKAITFEITTGGGTLPVWNFCMNMGFADYGCKDLSLPSWLWGFIKACMMFGAAILCRRLLIGA